MGKLRSMTDAELDQLQASAAERKSLPEAERRAYPYPVAAHDTLAGASWWAVLCLHQDRPFVLYGGIFGWLALLLIWIAGLIG